MRPTETTFAGTVERGRGPKPTMWASLDAEKARN